MHRPSTENSSVAGFSLVELLIAMTVTLIVMGITSALVAQSFRIRAREDRRSDAIADAQRALNIVSREIANTGFGLNTNGLVPGDSDGTSIRMRANLNAYESGSTTTGDADEDIKYLMYVNDDEGQRYLVRYDINLGKTDPKDGTTVLANRIDSFQRAYLDGSGATLDVATDPNLVLNAVRIRITVGVTLPEVGKAGSPGYQPPSQVQLVSDVALRNVSQMTY